MPMTAKQRECTGPLIVLPSGSMHCPTCGLHIYCPSK